MPCQQEQSPQVYGFLDGLRRWFFPQDCVVCGGSTNAISEICEPCQAGLPRVAQACARCAAPLPGGAAHTQTCGRCLTRPPHFDRARALYRYDAPIDRLVQGFKYGRRLDWGRVLAKTLAEHLCNVGDRADAIVPVPLHRRRLRERGYNQSLELARPIGRRLDIPVLVRAVRRARPTPAQAGLSRDARRRNVRNAFNVVQPLRIANKHIAIVDDVMTSGHTVDALARALRRAGAAEVSVWVLARA